MTSQEPPYPVVQQRVADVCHRPSRADLDHLWRGVTIAAIEFVQARATDLSLDAMAALLGPRAHGLSDLWDNWGRMRRLLLSLPEAA